MFFLLVILLTKHLFADWFFQSEWMVREKGRDPFAMLAHTGIHAIFTFVILAVTFSPSIALFYSLLDLFLHSLTDYMKAHPKALGRYPEGSSGFYNALGLDQWLHHMGYAFIVYDLYEGHFLEQFFLSL